MPILTQEAFFSSSIDSFTEQSYNMCVDSKFIYGRLIHCFTDIM